MRACGTCWAKSRSCLASGPQVLVLFIFGLQGKQQGTQYLDSRNYTEPLFVFAIMVVAGTRPGTAVRARDLVGFAAGALPLPRAMALCFLTLTLVPLLGSVITEPAAMTLAALMLRDGLFQQNVSQRLRYGVVGVLFVNVDWRHADALRRTTRVDGGRHLGLGHGLCVRPLWLEGGTRRHHQRGPC